MPHHPSTTAIQNPPDTGAEDEILTLTQLQIRLKLKTPYAVDHLVKRKVIPVIRLSGKTSRFYWPDVKAALAKRTVKAVSADR